MCLAVVAKLVDIEGASATADLHGNRILISTMLVPEAKVGDWILLHAGFAIQRIDAEAALRTWAVLEDLDNAMVANAGGDSVADGGVNAIADDESSRMPDSCDED